MNTSSRKEQKLSKYAINLLKKMYIVALILCKLQCNCCTLDTNKLGIVHLVQRRKRMDFAHPGLYYCACGYLGFLIFLTCPFSKEAATTYIHIQLYYYYNYYYSLLGYEADISNFYSKRHFSPFLLLFLFSSFQYSGTKGKNQEKLGDSMCIS